MRRFACSSRRLLPGLLCAALALGGSPSDAKPPGRRPGKVRQGRPDRRAAPAAPAAGPRAEQVLEQVQERVQAQVQERIREVETSLRGQLEQARSAASGALTQERRARVLADGRGLYLRYCATCHGAQGDGKGATARFLDQPPRDLRAGEYQFRMTPFGTLAREEDLFRTISVGIPGTAMPPWRGVLSFEQRRLLAQYVMALSPRYLQEQPGEPIEIPPEPPSDAESVARGKALYEEIQCYLCHGKGGRGDGPSAPTLADDWGNPIRPRDFSKGHFQGGKGGEVLYRTLSTGLSGSPMPSFADVIEPPRMWDLVHFIQSLAREPTVLDYLFGDPVERSQMP